MKTPTLWVSNPNKNINVPLYSDDTILYSSPLQDYVSPTVGLNEQNKPSSMWSVATKLATKWINSESKPRTTWTKETKTLTAWTHSENKPVTNWVQS